jgi:hypothetical protein
MKGMIFGTITAMVLVVFSFPAFGQEHAITEKEFEDVNSIAVEFLKKGSYRSIERDGPSETIYESVHPDRTRRLVTEKTNGVTKTTETIKIGPEIFIRKDGGKWEIPGPRDPNRYTIMGNAGERQRVNEYKLSTGMMLGSEKTDIYERKETTTYKSPAALRTVWTRRLWIDHKGRMVKLENIYTDASGTSSYTLIYEYDPKIRIEAPIKSSVKN